MTKRPSSTKNKNVLIYWLARIAKPVTDERKEEVSSGLHLASSPNFDYFLLVFLSAVIATLGLLTDSAAVIIGAMLVAPLMSPILGLGLASLTGDSRLFRKAGISLARGAILAILISAFLTWLNRLLPFISLQELPQEILARTHPSPIDLTIALAGGTAAAYALAQPFLSAALPGVAIATALMPPICTVGVGLAFGKWDVAGGAFLLFLTNAITIAFAAMVVFFVLGFTPPRYNKENLPRPLVVSAGLTLILLVPLSYFSVQFFQQAKENLIINEVVIREVSTFDAEMINYQTVENGEILEMSLSLRATDPLTYEDVLLLQRAIALALQRPVSIVVNQVAAVRLDPLVPPTFTPTYTPMTKTPTITFTNTITSSPTSTRTKTPTPTELPPTATPTPWTAVVNRTSAGSINILQKPGGPDIGKLRPGEKVYVLEGTEVMDGLVWLRISDAEGRIGWVPQIFLLRITDTPTPSLTPSTVSVP
ncbi:MAG: DUF389 domain-containing protein [Chloroflexota bacterium]